mgnify:CR=1 FL=1
MPRLRLADLLRRRKMTLRRLLDEFGITTYEGLVIRCNRMGVSPPDEKEFRIAFPDPPVNNPPEGVVVLEPPPVIDDITGRRIDPDAPVAPIVLVVTGTLGDQHVHLEQPTEGTQKKLRRKKEATTEE